MTEERKIVQVFRFHKYIWFTLLTVAPAFSQSIASGTISGTVSDPTGAVIPGAEVELRNPNTGYEQSAKTDASGAFRFNNVPFSGYRLIANAVGFSQAVQDIDVHATIPVTANLALNVASASTSVEVQANGSLVETDTSAHTDTDSATFSKLPDIDPTAGLSDIINNSTGATVSDANGFFHPEGDHAQVSYVFDGETISDQQSKVFSTQIPANAIQSIELITGAPDAEYGDKSSLVVNAVTKSGLGAQQPFGHQMVALRHQSHQHRKIGSAANVVGEIGHGSVEVKLAQDHMADRHGQGRVGALLGMEPEVGEFCRLAVIRADHHRFRPLVAGLGVEMRVRRAGLRYVAAPQQQEAGVVPVRAFRHVGLFAPGHRAGRRQVAVPVVETQANPAKQRQVA